MVVIPVLARFLEEDKEDDIEDDIDTNSSMIPTMDEVLEKAKLRHGINLDPKQTRAYEMICTTFMIKIINDQCT